MEDLGVQQAPHSTLNSWLEKLLYIVTGNFAKPGGMNIPPTSPAWAEDPESLERPGARFLGIGLSLVWSRAMSLWMRS